MGEDDHQSHMFVNVVGAKRCQQEIFAQAASVFSVCLCQLAAVTLAPSQVQMYNPGAADLPLDSFCSQICLY